jgi:hypothetical protein
MNLCEQVKATTGIASISWASEWGVHQFRACLLAFCRLFDEHKQSLNLQGRSLVFGTETGVSLTGNIVLQHDDVPSNWLQVCLLTFLSSESEYVFEIYCKCILMFVQWRRW